MNEVLNWIGKEDDVKITYDIVNPKNKLLALETFGGSASDLINRDVNEKDVAEIEWDELIKTADKIDYEVAVCCGIVSGLIDSFYVGAFSLERANEWGTDKVNDFVIKAAKLNGYRGDKGDIKAAIRHLERHHIAADEATAEFGGGKQHHLRDFSHHFSLGGLMCSIFTQFTGIVIGTKTDGSFSTENVKGSALIGKNFEEKIFFGVIEWFYHIVSDMAGSSGNIGNGTGIPGPLVSFIKELSILNFFENKTIKDIDYRTWISKLFNGTLLGKRNGEGKIIEQLPFDLRTEIGVLHEISRQTKPIIINECLTRALYFVRRIYIEIKTQEIKTITDLKKIEPENVLPLNNRTMLRMLTISSGTFAVVDTVDAGVRALIKNKGINQGFFIDFAIRINIAGVGRFAIACTMDGKKVLEDSRARYEREDERLAEFEKQLSELNCLSLTFEETRILYSIENLMMEYDIINTKKEKNFIIKKDWRTDWESNIIDGFLIDMAHKDTYFLTEENLVKQIVEIARKKNSIEWLHLVMMEAMMFEPYIQDKTKGKIEKQKFDSKYFEKAFCNKQELIDEKYLDSVRKAELKYSNYLTGKTTKRVVSAVGTITFAVATGGLALTFAPAIAPVIATTLFGESIAGLSGVALTSASLASLGGGALAAGGFGMAGGTAVITGGGAILGMLGGTGASATSSISLLSEKGYVLSECTKLLVFCREVLIDIYGDVTTVSTIQSTIEKRIGEMENQLDELKQRKNKDKKKMVKTCESSIQYLKKCVTELKRMQK